MNINQIRTIPIINKTFSRPVAFRATETQDTFEKTQNQAKPSDNKAVNWLEKNDYVNKHLIQDISNPENKIGSGFSHTAYSIPGNNDYVLRVANSSLPIKKCDKFEIKDTEDKNLKVNIGQTVAEIVLKDENDGSLNVVEILKRQKGEPFGVKPYSTIVDEVTNKLLENECEYDDPSRKKAYEESLDAVAKMPVVSFEKFLSDVNSAADSGYRFDYLNSNNILVDEENNSLNIIDTEYRGKHSKLDCGSILYALTNHEYFGTYTSPYSNSPMSSEKINKAIKNNLDIIDKFTTAMKNQGLKFEREKHSKEAQDLFFGIPMMIFCKENDYNKMWDKLAEKGLA